MNYPFKHFLTTLLIAPLILSIFDPTIYSETSPSLIHYFTSLLESYPVIFIFSLSFALPTFILYYVSYKQIVRTRIPDVMIKLLLNIEAIIGLIITFRIIIGNFEPGGILAYIAAIVLSSFFFKLRTPESPDASSTEQS